MTCDYPFTKDTFYASGSTADTCICPRSHHNVCSSSSSYTYIDGVGCSTNSHSMPFRYTTRDNKPVFQLHLCFLLA